MNPILLILLILSIGTTGLLIVRKWPDQAFWIILLLLFDPTGHFTVHLGKDALGGFYYRDFLFPLAFVPLFSSRVYTQEAFRFRPFQVLLGVQLIFLMYQIFVYGYWQSGEGWEYVFRYVLVRERMSVFGFMLIIPVFVMARRNLSFLVDLLVISTVIIYVLYFITILGGPEMLPVWQAERYRGTGILRYAMYSSGLTEMLIPLTFFVWARGIPYRYRIHLFFGSVMVVAAILLSLTKSSYIALAGLMAGSFFLYIRLYGSSLTKMAKVTTAGGLGVLVLVVLAFPEYPGIVWRQVQDLWLFITGDAYTSGMVEGRLVNQWPAHWAMIVERPFFGTGVNFSQFFSMRFHPSDYEVTDLPITGHLAMYGIAGLAVYSLFYIQFWRYVVKGYHRIKRHFHLFNELDVAIFFVVFAWMVKTFLFRPNYLFNELTTGTLLINLYAGLLLAVLFRSTQNRQAHES
ncbi:MAG: O-antigen ligase family protein [Marinilabiliaceae bacterium]